MARTTYVEKARKAPGSCMSPTCSHAERTIAVGESYKHFSIRSHKGARGFKKVYHRDCSVPRSHTTTSSQLGTIYDAQDSGEQAIAALEADPENPESLREIASQVAEGIREAGEMYGESSDNIESGFGHSTYVSDELREKADGCENWADEVENLDFEEYDPDDFEAFSEAPEQEKDESDEEFQARVEEHESKVEDEKQAHMEAWWEEQTSALEDAINNQPF